MARKSKISEAQIKALRQIAETDWRGVPMEHGGGVGFSRPTAEALKRAGLVSFEQVPGSDFSKSTHPYIRVHATEAGRAVLETL